MKVGACKLIFNENRVLELIFCKIVKLFDKIVVKFDSVSGAENCRIF